MTKRLRLAILIIFLAAFAAAAPLVILYTSGYRYNWKKYRLEKTGSIDLTTVPAGAAAAVNGVPLRRTTPLSAGRLLPEDYRVRLEKTGYLPWEKTLAVRSGETTFAKDIILFRDTLPGLVQPGAMAEAVLDAAGERVAWFETGDRGTELLFYDRTKQRTVLLARFEPARYAARSLQWSPDGKRLLFHGRGTDDVQTFILYEAKENGEVRLLSGALPPRVGRLRWGEGGDLVASAVGGAFIYDLAAGAAVPAVHSPFVTDALTAAGGIVIIRRNDDGFTVEFGPRSPTASRRPLMRLPASAEPAIIDVIDRILFVTDGRSGTMTAYDLDAETELDRYTASRVAVRREGNRLVYLLWNDFAIVNADPRARTQTTVTRLGTPITGCAWLPAGGWILFSTGTGISAIELDDRGGRNVIDLVRFTDVGSFTIDSAGKKLRFVGAAGRERGLYERDL